MSVIDEIVRDLRDQGVLTPRQEWTPTGWEAHFVHPYDGALTDWYVAYRADLHSPGVERSTVYSLPVEDWSSDGEPLVVDANGGRLKPAAEIDGFVKLVRTGRLHSALPAEPGWRVELDLVDGPDTVPVVAWLVAASGTVRPVIDKLTAWGGQLVDNEGELVSLPSIQVLRIIAP